MRPLSMGEGEAPSEKGVPIWLLGVDMSRLVPQDRVSHILWLDIPPMLRGILATLVDGLFPVTKSLHTLSLVANSTPSG